MNHQNPYESPRRVSGSRQNGSVRSHVGVRVCGVLNIIAGQTIGGGGLLLTLMILGFGGSVGEVMPALALLLAGGLSTISGVCLFFSSERAQNVALGLLALAVVLSLIYCVFIVLEVHPEGEEALMIIGLPGLAALLGIIELFYLWRQRSAK